MTNPRTYSLKSNTIDQHAFDADAVAIVQKLQENGFEAYLVGGCVRDVLCGYQPKDFDIATNARPEQVRKIFRSTLVIGKRFRLAHVRVRAKVFEVATFRAGAPDEEGLITADNRWGTIEEDAFRRDFTINALYYDPTEQTILDYVGGYDAIQHKQLTTIGDPMTRFRQDPVRMLRLIKFMARFGFYPDSATWEALVDDPSLLQQSAPPRVLEEMLRMLESGRATLFFRLMYTAGLLDAIFPRLVQPWKKEQLLPWDGLESVDALRQRYPTKIPPRSALLATLLYPPFAEKLQHIRTENKRTPYLYEVAQAASETVAVFKQGNYRIPKKLLTTTHFVLQSQYRFGTKKKSPKFCRHNDFLDALAFLRIRTHHNKKLVSYYNHWLTQYRA